MVTPLLSATDLVYGTPDGRVLQRGLNFEITSGELLLIRGANGAGKSTLLKIVLGNQRPISGSLVRHVARNRIAYLPQLENTEVHFPLTLADVLAIAQSSRVDWRKVESLGLLRESQAKTPWNTASGGERKRTLLTRALLKSPPLLVLDEPMNHLDAPSRAAVAHALGKYLSEGPAMRGVVIVNHQKDLHELLGEAGSRAKALELIAKEAT